MQICPSSWPPAAPGLIGPLHTPPTRRQPLLELRSKPVPDAAAAFAISAERPNGTAPQLDHSWQDTTSLAPVAAALAASCASARWLCVLCLTSWRCMVTLKASNATPVHQRTCCHPASWPHAAPKPANVLSRSVERLRVANSSGGMLRWAGAVKNMCLQVSHRDAFRAAGEVRLVQTSKTQRLPSRSKLDKLDKRWLGPLFLAPISPADAAQLSRQTASGHGSAQAGGVPFGDGAHAAPHSRQPSPLP